MHEITIQTVIQSFDHTEELPEAERRLLSSAHEALNHAYAPYSGFRVGAAVQLANGAIVSGSNQENAAYPMCLCAERVALAAAAAQFPGVPPQVIAIACSNRHKLIDYPASPCGACRQVLCETEDRYQSTIAVLLQGAEGPVYRLSTARALLPLAFTGETLQAD